MPKPPEPMESMRFVPEEIPSFIKAKTHHQKAGELSEPHQVFLERWKAFEFLYRDVTPLAQKEQQVIFGKDASEVDIITTCLTQLSRPRIDAILKLEEIGEMNAALSRRNVLSIVNDNLLLQELELSHTDWLTARKDLRFALKANTVKGMRAIGLMLLVVRAASDPLIKKKHHVIGDEEVLPPANSLLKDCVTHLIEHFQKLKDRFFEPSFRASHIRRV